MKVPLYYLTKPVERRDGARFDAGTILRLAGGASGRNGHFLPLHQHQGMVLSVKEDEREIAPGLFMDDGIALLDPLAAREGSEINGGNIPSFPLLQDAMMRSIASGMDVFVDDILASVEYEKREMVKQALGLDARATANGSMPANAKFVVMLREHATLKVGQVARIGLDESHLLPEGQIVVRVLNLKEVQYVTVKKEWTLPCDKDGWVTVGDDVNSCPIDGDTPVLVRYPIGAVSHQAVPAKTFRWERSCGGGRVVAFQIQRDDPKNEPAAEPAPTEADKAFDAATADEQAYVMLRSKNERLPAGQIVYIGDAVPFDDRFETVEIRTPENGVVYTNEAVERSMFAPCDRDGWVLMGGEAPIVVPTTRVQFKHHDGSETAYAEYRDWTYVPDSVLAFRIEPPKAPEPIIKTRHENINQGEAETRAAEDKKFKEGIGKLIGEPSVSKLEPGDPTDDGMAFKPFAFGVSIEDAVSKALTEANGSVREFIVQEIAKHVLPGILETVDPKKAKENVGLAFEYGDAWLETVDERKKAKDEAKG